MKKMFAWAGLLLATAVYAADGPVAAGKARASTACAVCHGPLGLAMAPNAPNLAGQNESYLIEQLKNYRSGKRQHEVMSVIAKPLNDQDIQHLAQWYASLQLQVEER
jgi:cytochrome c553